MVLPPEDKIPQQKFSAAATDTPTAADSLPSWSTLPGGVVDGGEIVVLAIKPSLWRPLVESATWILSCAALAFVMVRLGYALPGWSMAATVQLVVFAGFARLGYALVRWIPRWYVLTNRRIMDIEGIKEPRIWSCRLVDVRNTYLRGAPYEKIIATGTITVVTEDPKVEPRCWHSVTNPDQVHAIIRRAIEDAIDRSHHCD